MGPPFRAVVLMFQSHVSTGFLSQAWGREAARLALERAETNWCNCSEATTDFWTITGYFVAEWRAGPKALAPRLIIL